MPSFNFEVELPNLDEEILERAKKGVTEATKDFVEAIADVGYQKAVSEYDKAEFAGTKGDPQSVISKTVDKEKMEATITANHNSVLFIEYGTGVRNPYDAPEAKNELQTNAGIVAHGKYGHKRGANPKGWHYKGDMPSKPPKGTEESRLLGKGFIHTYGAPAHPFMYKAWKEVQLNAEKVFRRLRSDR